MTLAELVAVAEKALERGEALRAYADEEQSAALGLPPQTGSWGLVIFEGAEGRHATAACERALAAALEERAGDLPNWRERVRFWASGAPPELGPWISTQA